MRLFVAAMWLAFLCRGAFHSVMAPMWDGFDEPGHLAYIAFIADHGRPPGYEELSFPATYIEANRHLPSTVGVGAPTFEQWSKMTQAEREHHRALAAKITTDTPPSAKYISGNYERQQGPLFYYLAAPAYLVVESLPLPKIVVAMRLFCVLLASLTIPLSARLLRLLAGRRAVLLGLPIVALLPNTPFAVHRISNEALTWPLLAAIAIELVLVSMRKREPLRLGVLVAAGIWTKLTLLPTLVAALIAIVNARRGRRVIMAAAIPVVATLILLAWNKAASGTFTGLVQQTTARATTVEDVRKALERVRALPVFRELVKNHLWSGGWGFVKPPDRVYAVAAAIIAAILLAALIRRRPKNLRRAKLLIVVAVIYAGAMVFHIITGAIAAVQSSDFPTIGAEGWYLDMLRPIEAGVVAMILAAAIPPRRTRIACAAVIVALLLVDLAGTTQLMLPRWAGGREIRNAVDAAPVHRYPALPAALAGLYFAAAIAAISFGRRSSPRLT